MNIKQGYVYHIKDEYFEIVKDPTLMKNHESGKARPTYFCIKNTQNNILWFIPMSSKIEKYVDHVHIVNGKEAKVISSIEKEIKIKFNKLMLLINQGKKVIFTDINNDINIMLKELDKHN